MVVVSRSNNNICGLSVASTLPYISSVENLCLRKRLIPCPVRPVQCRTRIASKRLYAERTLPLATMAASNEGVGGFWALGLELGERSGFE